MAGWARRLSLSLDPPPRLSMVPGGLTNVFYLTGGPLNYPTHAPLFSARSSQRPSRGKSTKAAVERVGDVCSASESLP